MFEYVDEPHRIVSYLPSWLIIEHYSFSEQLPKASSYFYFTYLGTFLSLLSATNINNTVKGT